MSLSSVDITKRKKLNLGVKYPVSEETSVEAISAPLTDFREAVVSTTGDLRYLTIVAKYPLLEELIKGLDLVSIKTGFKLYSSNQK